MDFDKNWVPDEIVLKDYNSMMKSNYVELPNLGELMSMQFVQMCDVDEFYKHGNEFQKHLVDRTQILGKTNVGVMFQVQFLFPGTASLPDRIGYAREWHIDFNLHIPEAESPMRSHLLVSECEVKPEFNLEPLHINCKELGIKEVVDLNRYLSDNPDIMTPKKMEANRIHTFDTHPHRICLPTKPQLRFMYRVMEAPTANVKSWREACRAASLVGQGREEIATIYHNHKEKKIVMDYSKEDPGFYNNYNPKA